MGEWRHGSTIIDLGTTLRRVVKRFGRYSPKEIDPGIHWIEDEVDVATCLEVVEKRVESSPFGLQPVGIPTATGRESGRNWIFRTRQRPSSKPGRCSRSV